MSDSRNNIVTGRARLQMPLLNKGSAFSDDERARYGLQALLPAGVNSQAQQATRAYTAVADAPTALAKYRELMALQDRNEYLFHYILRDRLTELMPIVYTPTVGEATQRFSDVFQRGRGLWLGPAHRGKMREIIEQSVQDRDIRLVVATDNEAILGIGDQGAGGMGISIGKLALYTAGAGVAPECTLPISLDVGTNNQRLLEDPNYLGLRRERIRGDEYFEIVDEFVEAMTSLYPKVMIQWEDFSKRNALEILNRNRQRVPSFNDDIQGTGAVTVAGVLSAMRSSGEDFAAQRFIVYGAGAAGLGIARQIKAALLQQGVASGRLDQHIGLLDSSGLLVDDVPVRDDYKRELAWSAASAQQQGLGDPAKRTLADVVQAFKPTVLVGTSGQPGAFNESLVREIASYCKRPVIMPLSNPTSATEATPADVLNWTDGRALIASGSPFDPVSHGGRTYHIGQGNNVFIFPALGLASILGEVSEVTDGMITAAAQGLADEVSDEELESGLLYPDVSRLRDVPANITAKILSAAVEEGICRTSVPADIGDFVSTSMWSPDYERQIST